jgi:hypothetical protein
MVGILSAGAPPAQLPGHVEIALAPTWSWGLLTMIPDSSAFSIRALGYRPRRRSPGRHIALCQALAKMGSGSVGDKSPWTGDGSGANGLGLLICCHRS